jgi:hypothetical protein
MLPPGCQPHLDGVRAHDKHNGNGRGCRLGRRRGRRIRDNHGDLTLDQIGGHFRQAHVIAVGPTVVDGNIATFNKPCLAQALAKCVEQVLEPLGRSAVEEADDRHPLRLRGERVGDSAAQ